MSCLVNIGLVVLEKKFFFYIVKIFLRVYLFGIGHDFFISCWIYFTQGCFVPSLVEISTVEDFHNVVNVFWISFTQRYFKLSLVDIGDVVLKKRQNCEKFTKRQKDGWTDNRWSEKLTWAEITNCSTALKISIASLSWNYWLPQWVTNIHCPTELKL